MSKATKEKKILAHVELDVYIGEHDVFVRVEAPDANNSEKWNLIQQFYRWASAETGLKPADIWKSQLGYAVLPLRFFKALADDFKTRVISKRDFFVGGE